jgi:hypothetical protein
LLHDLSKTGAIALVEGKLPGKVNPIGSDKGAFSMPLFSFFSVTFLWLGTT